MQSLFDRHHRAVLFFSAGKDSLACLLLLKDFWDRLDVVWSNPGAPHPKTLEYMRKIAARVPSFIEVNGDQPAWIEKNGWPADVVPARNTPAGEAGAGSADIRLQPYFACCAQNMWTPMQRYLDESQHRLVIMGQRRDEPLKNRLRDERVQTIDGVDYFHPINDWTSPQVFDFLKDQGEPLPPFYALGAQSSTDCWNCTAYLDRNQNRLENMREHEPERWAIIAPVLLATKKVITREIRPLDALTHGMQS